MRYAFRLPLLLPALLAAVLFLSGPAPAAAQGQATTQEIRTMLQERDQ